MKINVGHFLAHRALLHPHRVGLVCEGRQWTFRELNLRANRLAHAMEKLGIRPGDRVGIVAANGVEHFDLFFGLGKTGGIFVPINYRLAAPELCKVLTDSGVRVLVYGPEFRELVEEGRKNAPPLQLVATGDDGRGSYEDLLAQAAEREPMSEGDNDDAVAIVYTAWPLGRPRGVMLTHWNFFWVAATSMELLAQLGPDFLLALPMYHIGALAWLPMFMHLATRCVLMPRFEPDHFLELVAKEGVTSFGAVPTMLHLIKDSPRFAPGRFATVNNILAYGQAVSLELIEEYASANIRIRQLYGLTESCGPALVLDCEHALAKAGSVGLPFFHTRVKLVQDNGLSVPVGTVGEVIIRAGHVMKGYWNQPEPTANALRDGWLYTGDLARQDEDGYFYIVDRKKELVISGGENIAPAEVESVIMEHPAVTDVAVIGFPDRVWGELVKAVVVKKPQYDLTAQEIKDWCRGKIGSYKIPREVVFADAMPRTLTGKMEKRKLRDLS
jgi:acyl-CoA synthetase (AMP-forming)/AMP-acid ligase II